MKSSEYFSSDNISLETSLSWLSDDMVRFKIEMGVKEKCTLCPSDVLASSLARVEVISNVIRGITYFRHKCIRLVREKLRIFPYGQYIVENVVLLADDIVRFKIEVRVEEKCTKM